MSKIFTVIFLCICSVAVYGQTPPDVIYRTDKTSFKAIIDEIGDVSIIYSLPNDVAKSNLLKISKKEVWKIIYGNGDIEIITAAEARPQAPKPESIAASKPVQQAVVPKPASGMPRPFVAIGADVIMPLGPREWIEKEGMGLGITYGGSAHLSYPLTKWLAAAANAGYTKWVTERNYVDVTTQNVILSEKYDISLIPIDLGVKIFPVKNLYLSPQVSYTLYHEKDSESNPESGTEKEFYTYKGGKLGYKASVGYERQFRKLVIQVSATYGVLIMDQFEGTAVMPDLTLAGAHIGFGYKF